MSLAFNTYYNEIKHYTACSLIFYTFFSMTVASYKCTCIFAITKDFLLSVYIYVIGLWHIFSLNQCRLFLRYFLTFRENIWCFNHSKKCFPSFLMHYHQPLWTMQPNVTTKKKLKHTLFQHCLHFKTSNATNSWKRVILWYVCVVWSK